MPRQHTIFGRPLPRIPPRRAAVLLGGISIFAITTVFIALPGAIPTGPSLSAYTDNNLAVSSIPHMPKMPKMPSIPNIPVPEMPDMPDLSLSHLKGTATSWTAKLNPFKQPSHPPPRQANDTFDESSWYTHFKWLQSPFSSSITLDENRAVLPPKRVRPAIYCYYDSSAHRDQSEKDAESALLLTWRRAWWAQGFKPSILSSAEAINNPLYEELQRKPADKMDDALRAEIMRWLAWENMRGGILSDYLLLPMAPYDGHLLSYLRRGEYPGLTRWKDLNSGLFVGAQADVAAAIKLVLGNSNIPKDTKDFVAALPSKLEKDPFTVDNAAEELAFYDPAVLGKKYKPVADAVERSRAEGFVRLNELITSHLHITWQNVFSSGIAVLKPIPEHTSAMIAPAFDLATRLASCLASPLQSSCPPNLPNCTPCVANQPLRVSTPPHYRNQSALYTIGVVPHPYTFQLLSFPADPKDTWTNSSTLDIPYLRRQSRRDRWLHELTKELLGSGRPSSARILSFKEAVAGSSPISDATARSLWLAAEKPIPTDYLDWHFGFPIPTAGHGMLESGKSETPVPGPERRPQPERDGLDGPIAKPEDIEREERRLEEGRKMGASVVLEDVKLRNAVEAWNLADVEAWRFARAFLARSQVERLEWEKEEQKYAGGAGTEKR